MEIELKYRAFDPDVIDRIFSDPLTGNRDSEITMTPMNAVYYDTEDRVLSEMKIAFRIRKEGNAFIATMKWNSSEDAELSRREEYNIPVTAEDAENPSLELFREIDRYDELAARVGDRKLAPLLEMRFVRRAARMDTGTSIFVVSADLGEIIGGRTSVPIGEVEFELYSGDEKEMIQIGRKVAEKYGLKKEEKSKLQRGLELL